MWRSSGHRSAGAAVQGRSATGAGVRVRRRRRRQDPAASRRWIRLLPPRRCAEPCDCARFLPARHLIRGGSAAERAARRSAARRSARGVRPGGRAGGRRGGRCCRSPAAAWRPRTKGRRWSRCCPRYGCRSAAPAAGGCDAPRGEAAGEGGAGGASLRACAGGQSPFLGARGNRLARSGAGRCGGGGGGGFSAPGRSGMERCACVYVCRAGASTLPPGSPRYLHRLPLGTPASDISFLRLPLVPRLPGAGE